MLLQIPSARTHVWIKIEPSALTCYCTSTPFLRYALALQVEIAVQLKYQDECQSLTWTENGSIKKHVIDHCCLGWFQWLCNKTLIPRLSRAVGLLAQVPKFHASCESWSKTPLVGAHSTGRRSSESMLQQTWQMACQTTNGQETCGSRHIHNTNINKNIIIIIKSNHIIEYLYTLEIFAMHRVHAFLHVLKSTEELAHVTSHASPSGVPNLSTSQTSHHPVPQLQVQWQYLYRKQLRMSYHNKMKTLSTGDESNSPFN